jgi:hypothetical protein
MGRRGRLANAVELTLLPFGHAVGVIVIPAKAGIQKIMKNLDSVFRRNDEAAALRRPTA